MIKKREEEEDRSLFFTALCLAFTCTYLEDTFASHARKKGAIYCTLVPPLLLFS